MRRGFVKRGLSLVMALVLTGALVACGGGDSSSGKGDEKPGGKGNTASSASIDKNLIYKETPIGLWALPVQMDHIGSATMVGDRIFMPGFVYGAQGTALYIISMNKQGGDIQCHPCGTADGGNYGYSSPAFDRTGNVYTVKTVYPAFSEEAGYVEEDIEEEDTEEPSGDSGVMNADESPKYYLLKMDAAGNTVFEKELFPEDYVEDVSNFWVSDCRYIEGMGIIMQVANSLYLCSEDDGSTVRPLYKCSPNDYLEYAYSGSGKIYLATYEGDFVFRELDLQSGKPGENIALPAEVNRGGGASMFKPGGDCDFLLNDADGISEWNVGDKTVTKLLSFTDSDMMIEYVSGMLKLSDTRLIITYDTVTVDGEYTQAVVFLDKVNPEDIIDKKVLTIGTTYVDSKLRNMVVHYNKSSDNYKIKLVDYSQYDSEENWNAGELKLNADLVSGTAPDMLYMNMGLSVQSLIAKGVFEPLDDYLENDAEIASKEYVEKVLDAYKFQNRTYLMIPSFAASSYVMKKADADRLTEWNLRTLEQMIQDRNLNPALAFGYPMTNTSFLESCMAYDADTYLDWDNGKAMFNTEQFIALLNFCKTLPENADEYWTDDAWEKFETAYREGRAILSQFTIYNLRDYARLKYLTFGEEIEFVGFPRMENAGGATVIASSVIGMNSRTADKGGCWEFMRKFYLDDFQNTIVKENWELPIARAQLNEVTKKSMEKPYYMGEFGEKVEYEDYEYLAGDRVTIPPLSQEDVDQVLAYLEEIDTVASYDEKVFTIVYEESMPFFKGQKTAEECAQIIQSKVQLYMDENS